MPLAVVADILKKFVARQIAAVLDDTGEPAVVDVGFVALAALAAKADVDTAAVDRDMAIAQRGQAEALVRLGVFGVADADKRHFHQANDRRQNLFARQTAAPQIGFDTGADQRQDASERQKLCVFRLVAHLAPARMVAVLLAPARVAAGRLQMTVRVGANPHLGPGRRNSQRPDAPQYVDVADQCAVGTAVVEPVLRGVARNAGRGVADITQLGALRRDLRVQRLRERRIDFVLPPLVEALLLQWRHFQAS